MAYFLVYRRPVLMAPGRTEVSAQEDQDLVDEPTKLPEAGPV